MGSLLTIVTQNLNGNYDDDTIKENYMNALNKDRKTKPNIYAFQEFKRQTCSKRFSSITDFKVTLLANETVSTVGNERAEALWDEAFPWMEFKSGYWKELELSIDEISIDTEEITIINIHISPTYEIALKNILLKRLEELKGKKVILLGDFNAAFENQTEKPIKENDKFLKIIQDKGFKELPFTEEKLEDCYTYIHRNENEPHEEKKKIDHIFISKNLKHYIINHPKIEYIGNISDSKEKDAHRGILTTLEFDFSKNKRLVFF